MPAVCHQATGSRGHAARCSSDRGTRREHRASRSKRSFLHRTTIPQASPCASRATLPSTSGSYFPPYDWAKAHEPVEFAVATMRLDASKTESDVLGSVRAQANAHVASEHNSEVWKKGPPYCSISQKDEEENAANGPCDETRENWHPVEFGVCQVLRDLVREAMMYFFFPNVVCLTQKARMWTQVDIYIHIHRWTDRQPNIGAMPGTTLFACVISGLRDFMPYLIVRDSCAAPTRIVIIIDQGQGKGLGLMTTAVSGGLSRLTIC